MPEEIKKENSSSQDLSAKIEQLETLLRETEETRRQGMVIARLSILAILIALGVFAWNLFKIYENFTSENNLKLLKEQVLVDLKDVMNGPEVRLLEKKIVSESAPKVANIFIERFKKELPMFKDKGNELLNNMKVFIENHLKEELTKVLEESMADIEKDLQKKFPDLNPEKLHKTITAAQYVFIEDITDHLEQNLVDLSTMFDGLERTISEFRNTEDYKALSEKELDDIKLELAEAVLELAIYEVNPPRGEKKYEGGSK
ncbi:MAG TPA: hypothetical protein P5270_05025 [Victivallales bacterium]|nr:hypothetical protein [Victivallales bacterium]HPO91277.1 hypothetical protein [Victivallales bacterium]HRR28706.1 hypothetical protein [Victivallales bacterium]HRU00926.1 hypothetical protein [Victivallales bacterium]